MGETRGQKAVRQSLDGSWRVRRIVADEGSGWNFGMGAAAAGIRPKAEAGRGEPGANDLCGIGNAV